MSASEALPASTGAAGPSWPWTVAAGAASACAAAYLTLAAIELIDPQRLVPISGSQAGEALAFAGVLYGVGLVVVARWSQLKYRIPLFTAAFFLRVLLGVTLAAVFQYDDERGFDMAGRAMNYGLFSVREGAGYYHVVNLLYAAVGPNLLLPKMVNALIGALLPFLVYATSLRLLGDRRAAGWAFALSAFAPPLLVFSSLNLKEMATAALLVLAIWGLASTRQTSRVAAVVASIGALYWLRGAPWAAVPAIGVVAHALADGGRLRGFLNGRRLLTMALAAGLLAWFVAGPISRTITMRLSVQGDYFVQRVAGSTATVMQFIDTSDILAPRNLVVFFVRGLFSPSPLRFVFDPGVDVGIEAAIMLTWYVLFPMGIAGALAWRRHGAMLAAGAIALVVLTMANTAVMFGADPYRHRINVVALGIVLAAGALRAGRAYAWVYYLWWGAAIAFNIIWMSVRMLTQ